MRFNPTAVTFWAFTAAVGFLVGGTFTAAVAGLAVGLGFTLIADFFL